MAQSNVNIRIDSDLKKDFDAFCSQIGLSASAAFNIFAKTVVREQRIPFELTLDPFYSPANMERLNRSIKQMDTIGGTAHELIEEE